jgi:hypothetical protein
VTDAEFVAAVAAIRPTARGCRLWKPMLVGKYRRVMHRGRFLAVHRRVYALTVGPIPDGHVVHHRCRDGRCCERSHLRALTASAHSRHHITGEPE